MSRPVARLVRDAAELAALEPAWWALWRRSPGATPFSSPAWLLPWWEAFAPGPLAAVAVEAGPRLVGLGAFWLEDGRHGPRLLPLGLGISDHTDVLVDPHAAEAGAALVEAVAALPGWDKWELEELPPDAAALRLAAAPGWAEQAVDQTACPVLDLAGPEPVPSRQRRKLRMSRHRAERRGLEILDLAAEAADPCAPASYLAELARLHGARWAERGEDGLLAAEPVRRFHALALPRLLAAGLAWPLALRIENRVAGAAYLLRDDRAAYAYLGGFDPDFAFESPGTILIGHAIERAREAGLARFSFLRGREPYKYAWGAADVLNRHRRLVRP